VLVVDYLLQVRSVFFELVAVFSVGGAAVRREGGVTCTRLPGIGVFGVSLPGFLSEG